MKIELPQTALIDRSAIEWTGPTWNPWQGCRKVSPGCKFCYMYRDKKRYGQDPRKVVVSADSTFNNPLRWQREAEAGVRKGQDLLVFTCSWSDWFIEEADAWRDRAWEVIRRCPSLTFQILTKRHDRMAAHLPSFWEEIKGRCWLGISAEDQPRLNERLPALLAVDASVRFLSLEPLLGPIILPPWIWCRHHLRYEAAGCMNEAVPCFRAQAMATDMIDWVIVGGESGPGARLMHPDWARSLRDQCQDTGIAFFFKQWGEWLPYQPSGQAPFWESAGGGQVDSHTFPDRLSDGDPVDGWWLPDLLDGVVYRHVGKKAAGRQLNGRTWDEFPRR